MIEAHAQNSTGESDGLGDRMRGRVLERLGFSRPPPINLAGLRALYRGSCVTPVLSIE